MLKWLQHFNLCENIRINQEREEFESLRSEMRYYMRKEQERAKQNLISQNASKEENKEERKGILLYHHYKLMRMESH